jgi:hypothetical protein
MMDRPQLSQENITTCILLIGEASGVFAGFCPSWFTVSSPFFHEQDAKAGNVKRIRWGEAAATAIVVATGAGVAWQMSDPVPLVASLAICAIFIGGYEYMIANPSKNDGDGDVPVDGPDRVFVNQTVPMTYG